MTSGPLQLPRNALPTRSQAAVFLWKSALLRVFRAVRELGRAPRLLVLAPIDETRPVAAESRTLLYTQLTPGEQALQAGKVHNLRLAARALHGRVIPAGEVFSFWANVGRATRARGYVAGRELREGCVIPNVGGGLCQLSNALYDLALQSGAEIVERHAHTRQVPGSQAAAGRDATIFWNYVDLRFRPATATQISVTLTSENLVVRFLAAAPSAPTATAGASAPLLLSAESCEACGINDCFRHASAAALPQTLGSAWLVDAFQPEHHAWMTAHRRPEDSLLLPLKSRRYPWSASGMVRHAPLTALRRSLTSRRLARQGAARQRALLAMDEAMARALARRLPPLARHVTISQNLLPFLWEAGVLGGRTFDVFMTRLPMRDLEATLDAAARQHPESPTLADFRAPDDIVRAEAEALAAARQWITPHSAIAGLAGCRAAPLEWQLPQMRPAARGRVFVFPASTLGRKGAYDLRSVARELHLPIRLGGPVLEGENFWQGVEASPAGDAWLDGAAAVVLPAWVEHQPRRLLRAVAAGVPVIASEACGLRQVQGVTTIPTGDAGALRAACENLLSPASPAAR